MQFRERHCKLCKWLKFFFQFSNAEMHILKNEKTPKKTNSILGLD